MNYDSPSPEWYEPRDLDEPDVTDEPIGLPEPLVISHGVVTWTLIDSDD